jgi:hypothetical protein
VIDDAWLEAQDKKRDRNRYSMPHFYFVARSGGIRQRSGLLRYHDWIDIDLEDDDGKKLGNQTYRLHLASGEVREGKLDGNGHAREENVPPGRCGVEFPELYGQSDTQSRETD